MAKPTVSVIIPTRNEEGCIGRLLSEMPRDIIDEIIIVDGHSTDGTVKEVKSQLKPDDKLVNQKGYGYGAAFRQGFKLVGGNVIVMMDGDGSNNPKSINGMMAQIDKGYDYVMGSRYIKGAKSYDDTPIRFFGNKFFTWLTNIIHGTQVSDSLHLYTAVRKKSLDKLKLKSSGFEFCTEIVVKAHKAGLKFAEVPVIERARYAGKSKVNSLWHGLKILRMIIKRY